MYLVRSTNSETAAVVDDESKTTNETFEMLSKVYSESIIVRSKAYEWHRALKMVENPSKTINTMDDRLHGTRKMLRWCMKLTYLCVAAVAEWYRYRTVACFVTGSSPVPLKTRRVGQRCTLNLSRAETSSRWCGVVVRRGGASSGVVHVT
ncbi:uncharacterized protein TNCV_1287111 [Trichonephila clavipes]|nr:uncharacterized protein TNCV_1287111 [Trichonephila clavipes]